MVTVTGAVTSASMVFVVRRLDGCHRFAIEQPRLADGEQVVASWDAYRPGSEGGHGTALEEVLRLRALMAEWLVRNIEDEETEWIQPNPHLDQLLRGPVLGRQRRREPKEGDRVNMTWREIAASMLRAFRFNRDPGRKDGGRPFEELPVGVQAAWEAAARHVARCQALSAYGAPDAEALAAAEAGWAQWVPDWMAAPGRIEAQQDCG